eukprot:CAMPEP_0181216850 /NCGR_PEP_ID=MMETSP1096-20121128/26821_1 /TAXON_ID=156174 ORGANISM="Chrysochromulina ericina, Strain CCMP281" /NCGR_SAMPLE_ID=MMETSP1096 /ASSEMBLY_ACC=CAM_ASM_000453 /LENGTH=67 /DNA_ID=CAMNT_0023308909 /DNA_START=658 /DNA_END=862 /DNA_ORIENTATION=+
MLLELEGEHVVRQGNILMPKVHCAPDQRDVSGCAKTIVPTRMELAASTTAAAALELGSGGDGFAHDR